MKLSPEISPPSPSFGALLGRRSGCFGAEEGKEAIGPKGAINCRLVVIGSAVVGVRVSVAVVGLGRLPSEESKSFNCLEDAPAWFCICEVGLEIPSCLATLFASGLAGPWLGAGSAVGVGGGPS